jgi:hypothetical protein
MVSRFAKPQIGQTSAASKMGLFTADLEDEISTDYTDYADYSVRVKQRHKPGQSDEAKSKCGDDPKYQSRALYSIGLGARRAGITKTGRQIKMPKSQRKKQHRRADKKGPVRFEQA